MNGGGEKVLLGSDVRRRLKTTSSALHSPEQTPATVIDSAKSGQAIRWLDFMISVQHDTAALILSSSNYRRKFCGYAWSCLKYSVNTYVSGRVHRHLHWNPPLWGTRHSHNWYPLAKDKLPSLQAK